ncbi:MAG: Cof-type HAD-IIB family hydrolase [Oscillospiraceae bacterium]|nr:Cof-type HAD-IIB family hydrolase [Oscillospiraceae bacterium]MDE7279537.1 Cof-type HAD-IIB family hydrolase [Oscillospiraceae bacterium]
MSDFSKKVLITDLDGTLLPISKIVSEKDLNAIDRFRRGGGIFTIATGRIIQAAEQYFDILKPDAPVILNNGGLIYDTKKRETVYECCLDTASFEYTKALVKRFPEIGVEVNLPDGIFVVRMTEWERRHLDMTHLPYTEKNFDEIPKSGWCKVLYSMGGGMVRELSDYAAAMGWDKTSFVISGDFLFECLPKDCTKGSALKKLWEIEKWNDFTVVAVGDYDNDIEMLEFADVGIAPQNAQGIVKKSANYVTKSTCEEGVIAEAINYLEKL